MWILIYENPGGVIVRNTVANIVLSFKLNVTFFKMEFSFPSVSRIVLFH